MKVKLSKLYFSLIGLGALIWFLIRVIPKPSRATYPCQRAAFPIASAFVIYIISLFTTSYAFLQFKRLRARGNHLAASVFLIITALSSVFLFQSDKPYTYAGLKSFQENPNEPVGTGKGIFPGRVVWVRDTTAVDQNLTNNAGDYWWMDINADQAVINNMLSEAIKALTGKETDAEAWDAVFRYYNQTHSKGDVGYTPGERIVIKINLNNGASGYDYTRFDNRPVDTSPQVVFAVLDQLINVAGVAQSDIEFGDPGRNIDNIFWNKFHQTFPDVKYWGNGNGRTPIEPTDSKVFFSSNGRLKHYLPKCYVEAAYMINIPVFKQHHRAGISLGAKNHIGTFVPFTPDWIVRDSLHHSFPSSQGDGNVDNGDYFLYRLFVDFMGHRDIGDKTILYLLDDLWSSTDYNGEPWKWRTAPFNTTYPASIFVSFDPVAVESVGFDLLFNEFYIGNPSGKYFPRYDGVDDFLHQAADSVNWAPGILYDPENDGKYLARSLGVHEHWNNPNDMQYTRDLGGDDGIELVKIKIVTGVNEITTEQPDGYYLGNNYPNPFNPATSFRYSVPEGTNVSIIISDLNGRRITELLNKFQNAGVYEAVWDGRNDTGQLVASGTYVYTLKAGSFIQSRKMILMK